MGGKIVAAAFRDALEEPEVCDEPGLTLIGWRKASAGYDATDS